MNELTYVDVPGAAAIQCKVKLNNKVVGAIYKSPTGYYYKPAGRGCGDTFKTVDEVKATL